MAEDTERLPSGANLLGLILKIETERAEKYRNILLQLAGPSQSNGIGVSRVLPGGASIYPTFGALLEQAVARPPAERGGVDRNSRPEAEDGVTDTAQSAAVPSASTSTLRSSNRLSTITGGSSSASRTSSTTRGRKSASHGGSARTSKRTLLRPSFEVLVPTVTVNGRTRMRSQKSSGQSSRQRSAPTSPPFVLTGTSGLGSFISLVEIFTRAGLTPLPLTRAEVIRSEETPGLTWRDVCGVLGGNWRAEWVECQKIPGYKKFFCADHRAQPYLPTGTGQPGLIFCPPTITPENDNVAFQVLSYSPQDNLLYYQGEYTKVPLSRIQVSFCDLPAPCRELWTKRFSSGRKHSHAAILARIKLRNQLNQEPSVAEVQEYLRRPTAPTTQSEVTAAFRAGEEKMICYGIRCITYDSNFATIIQRKGRSNNN